MPAGFFSSRFDPERWSPASADLSEADHRHAICNYLHIASMSVDILARCSNEGEMAVEAFGELESVAESSPLRPDSYGRVFNSFIDDVAEVASDSRGSIELINLIAMAVPTSTALHAREAWRIVPEIKSCEIVKPQVDIFRIMDNEQVVDRCQCHCLVAIETVDPAEACAGGFPGMTAVSNEISA